MEGIRTLPEVEVELELLITSSFVENKPSLLKSIHAAHWWNVGELCVIEIGYVNPTYSPVESHVKSEYPSEAFPELTFKLLKLTFVIPKPSDPFWVVGMHEGLIGVNPP